MRRTEFGRLVYAACRKIPRGRVSTYAAIARAAGRPKACRAAGNALSKNRSPDVPCHRVVRGDGSVGGFVGEAKKKERMLRAEGVRVRNGRVEIGPFSRRKGSS